MLLTTLLIANISAQTRKPIEGAPNFFEIPDEFRQYFSYKECLTGMGIWTNKRIAAYFGKEDLGYLLDGESYVKFTYTVKKVSDEMLQKMIGEPSGDEEIARIDIQYIETGEFGGDVVATGPLEDVWFVNFSKEWFREDINRRAYIAMFCGELRAKDAPAFGEVFKSGLTTTSYINNHKNNRENEISAMEGLIGIAAIFVIGAILSDLGSSNSSDDYYNYNYDRIDILRERQKEQFKEYIFNKIVKPYFQN